ncbi:type VI secretion system tip protein TssI/VgrG [Pseudomonas sp. HR96]|uniref:type VI secretion system Vgr family protein n=1 Tax=Pseudomonas sp. HR96 TaxID=1027966 RepID=UPI002A74D307|nr:type VI secretion system tip protein TssI/VgrG [Pseudomonas sp. HR96]WPO98793.1 type VI secretion system tip protein TssI/VgrG [Pseudomonas sp. HR96]
MARQSDLRYTFAALASEAKFEVVSFDLTEGLSQPFLLSLTLSSHDPNIDFAGLLDCAALFTLWHGDTPVRHVHGLISTVQVGQSGFRRTQYQVVIEPQLARLALCSNWRIFQHQSVPQIIDQVLGEHHLLNREQHLTSPHQPREYCVQAGETDLAFLARLAAEEGLLYSFEHDDKGHRLVYTDRILCLAAIGEKDACSVLYQGAAGGDQPQPALNRFSYTEKVCTARQVQRDYTFTHPRYNLQHSHQGRDLQRQGPDYERFDYPGRYKRDAAGQPFTETRLLALRNSARVAEATGDDPRVRPGREFQLVEHPRQALNAWWRPVYVEHQGAQALSQEEDAVGAPSGTYYTQTAQLVDGRAEWKAELLPPPRISGTQTATVTGPPGEEIYCDEWGRVKVSFPWDRESSNDDKSSCWVRVSQGWAGTMWGAMAIPRVGQEVLVGFNDGDPDQPIIIGRAYRADNRPPYELPRHKTRMSLKSQTHKGEGFNELRFEDELGQQEVFIHAERDQNNRVKHDETTEVGHDRTESVGHDERVSVGNDQFINVFNNRALNVHGHQHSTVVKDWHDNVENSRYQTTTADHRSEVGGNSEGLIKGQRTLTIGGGGKLTTTTYRLDTSERLVLTGPGGSITIDAGGVFIEGITVNVAGPITAGSKGRGNDLGLQLLAAQTKTCEGLTP